MVVDHPKAQFTGDKRKRDNSDQNAESSSMMETDENVVGDQSIPVPPPNPSWKRQRKSGDSDWAKKSGMSDELSGTSPNSRQRMESSREKIRDPSMADLSSPLRQGGRGNPGSNKRQRDSDGGEKTSGSPDGMASSKRQRVDGDGVAHAPFTSPYSPGRMPRLSVSSGISPGADPSVLLTPTKNAVCALNELRPGLTYTLVSQVGPVHAPLFTISVEVNGQSFRGTGRSKKRAKKSAAEAALRSFVQFKNSEEVAHAMGIGGAHPGNPGALDFTMDVVHNEGGLYNTFAPAQISESRSGKPPLLSSHLQRRSPQEVKSPAPVARPNGVSPRGNPGPVAAPPVKTSAAVKLESLRARATQPGATPPPPCILSPADKGPVTMLNELRPGLKYECLSENGEQYAKFTMSVVVDGQQFKGMGPSKKLGKAAAAKAALAKMFNITFSPFASLVSGQGSPATPPSALIASPSLLLKKLAGDRMSMPQTLADHIASLVISKFSTLAASLPVGQARRKVLSGIVMTGPAHLLPHKTSVDATSSADSPSMSPTLMPGGEGALVLCLGTGTKCVGGGHLSESGTALNDTHAEVVARRCLLDFFYSQLEDLVLKQAAQTSIFEHRPSGYGYRVKQGIKFHLYINTAPCGDARIFSPHELGCMQGAGDNQAANGSAGSGGQSTNRGLGTSGVVSSTAPLDRHPNRRARGQLRTKIESGEGTIPVKSSDGIQTWDGVMQGQRLLTMSCSDKVCKWNVVGLQGSLLSHLVEPIYLDSVVLGSLFHPSHLYRAMCGRVEPWIQGLPPPFRLNKPLMALISSPEIRQAGKAPSYSVNWTIGKENPEVINSVTGKDEAGQASRLCKRFFFRRFLRLINPGPDSSHQQNAGSEDNCTAKRPSAVPLIPFPECFMSMPLQYSTAKDAMADYQAAKQCLLEAFRKGGLGTWLKKPMEQDQFELIEEEFTSESIGE
ncbi:double-stranded RNA-specific editase Adar-like isoform X2 [Ischnura elegans]|uniref:double-stranded RNA-specific editase Adar-like isoform X2 n=1 Tax=Ischnura elegans TaxID=197161 RepID=UPI001ED88540|nr:double-stranded RNA-specific editase Adar-like isoform X2 [Ischnura elegans]